MNEDLVILRDRFRSLEETLDLSDQEFMYALFDYCAYIGSSPRLSEIVKEMAKEFDIDANTFHWLYILGALRMSFRTFKTGKMDKQPFLPLFFDKEIEDKYQVAKALGMLIYMSKDAPHLQAKENINILDIVSDETGKLIKNEEVPFKSMVIKFRLFQNDLLSRLIEPKKLLASFDPSKSELIIGKKKVRLRKHTEQFHTLRIIFEDPKEISKEWFFSEISEKIDKNKGYTDKDLHNYISAIKRRVASETGLNDIFLTTNQSVRVNEKYLNNLK